MSINPYAAPEAPLEYVDRSACWPMGKSELYLAKGSDLPMRCVKCNAPAVQPIRKRTLYWHASGWYLFVLINVLIYAIAALVVRKKIQVSPGLCEHHARRRNFFRYGSLAVFTIAVVLGLASIGNRPGAVLAAFATAFASIFVGVLGSRTVYPVEIDDRGARLKGCSQEFLASLRTRSGPHG